MTPERFNEWRIFPRLMITAYYGFFAGVFVWLSDWFMHFDWTGIDNQAVALAVAGFPAAVLGILSGVLANLTGKYLNPLNQGGKN